MGLPLCNYSFLYLIPLLSWISNSAVAEELLHLKHHRIIKQQEWQEPWRAFSI